MKYLVRAMFYRGGEEESDYEDEAEGHWLDEFEAESDDEAFVSMKTTIAEGRQAFSRVFKLYREASESPIYEIIKPPAYEVDGIYTEDDGSEAHYIFDAFDAKNDAEARHKVLERSTGNLAGAYRRERLVQLYRVPFHHETAKPFADRDREFLGNIEISDKEQAG